ncbi:MAG: NAD-dependent epimerase/dehydratase family protein [Chlamydiales bacterium]|nr:NAD-dependent epimerase/dehydratase family protein [Chlamydiales bacterium]
MKNILITGIAGFIGSNLAERLLQEGGFKIIGIDNLSAGVREQVPQEVMFYPLDIRERSIYPLFKGVDTVFHLAAKNCIHDCQTDPVETASINVLGTVNVFEAARQAGVRKVVYAESSSLYEGSSFLPTPESEIKPESFYAASKAAPLFFANSYRRYSDLTFTALRYFCAYGPRQDYRRTVPPVMSSFIIHLLQQKRPTIYGSGQKKRDFIHIDDINDFHLQTIVDPRTDHKTFNLGSGVNYSVQEVFDLTSSLLGSHLEPVYQSDLQGEAEATLACIEEARALGWSPKISLEQGLLTSIQFIREKVL